MIEQKEFHIVGPPGTGKTTELARQARRATEKYDPERIMLTSLTKAAAAEIAGRETPIPKKNIGTLHSLCYRSLHERITIAETKFKDFNDAYPQFRLSTENSSDPDNSELEAPSIAGIGDQLLAQANLYRQQMIPLELWNPSVQVFWDRYSNWKRDCEYMDFTDLIEYSLEHTIYAPGSPDIIFGDECQDWSKLEAALMRKWGQHCERFVLVGDPDQAIYEWRGADPRIFIDTDLPDNHIRVLHQSYRVSTEVHKLAMSWIQRIKSRAQVEYFPKQGSTGSVMYNSTYTFKNPERMILDDVLPRAESGQSVMVLATCAFMLEPIKKNLRAHGIPFHNPFRVTRGDWNPLRKSKGISAKDRIIAFLRQSQPHWGDKARSWSWDDLRRWAAWVKSEGLLKRGAKKLIDDHDEGQPTAEDYLERIFIDYGAFTDSARASSQGNVDWYMNAVMENKYRILEYPVNVLQKRGLSALNDQPKIIIGTIHSVKGGEADSVFLFPDISLAAARSRLSDRTQRISDALIRLFYVAITRSACDLTICGASTPCNMGEIR